MDKKEALNLVKKYADEIKKFLLPSKIVMYGSYAKGNATANSDIDVAIIFNNFKGDLWATSTELWKSAYKISDIIEPVLLDQHNDGCGFIDEILKTGIIIYQAEE